MIPVDVASGLASRPCVVDEILLLIGALHELIAEVVVRFWVGTYAEYDQLLRTL